MDKDLEKQYKLDLAKLEEKTKKFKDLATDGHKELVKKLNYANAIGETVEVKEVVTIVDSAFSQLNNRIEYIWDEIRYLSDRLYKHTNGGHLPNMKTPSEMENALDVLGVSKNYEVRKDVVYVD